MLQRPGRVSHFQDSDTLPRWTIQHHQRSESIAPLPPRILLVRWLLEVYLDCSTQWSRSNRPHVQLNDSIHVSAAYEREQALWRLRSPGLRQVWQFLKDWKR
jgi:hypothetical protein